MRGKGVEILRCRPNPESPPAIFVSPLREGGGGGGTRDRPRAARHMRPHGALWPRMRPRATRLACPTGTPSDARHAALRRPWRASPGRDALARPMA